MTTLMLMLPIMCSYYSAQASASAEIPSRPLDYEVQSQFNQDSARANVTSYSVGVYNSTHYYAEVASTGSCDYFSKSFAELFAELVQNDTTVSLQDGTFMVDQQLCIGSSSDSLIDFRFEGQSGSIIKNTATLTVSTILVSSRASNVTICDLKMDGSLSTGSECHAITAYGKNVLIDHVEAYNYPSLLIAINHGAKFCTVSNCILHDCLRGPYGVGVAVNNCSNVQVLYNRGYNLLESGIDIYQGANNVLVDGNLFEECEGGGVVLEYWYEASTDPWAATVHDIVISDNTITACGYGGNGFFGNTTAATGGYGGVLIQKSTNIVVSNNHITNCGRGVLVGNYRSMSYLNPGGSEFITISGNDISASNYQNATNGEGILLDNLYNGTVTNNTIHDNYGDGIFVNHGCEYITIDGNHLTGNGMGISNTYSGIHVGQPAGAPSKFLTITDNIIDDYAAASRNYTRYGIYDEGYVEEHMILTDNKCVSSLRANIFLGVLNPYVSINSCWNGTTLIDKTVGAPNSKQCNSTHNGEPPPQGSYETLLLLTLRQQWLASVCLTVSVASFLMDSSVRKRFKRNRL